MQYEHNTKQCSNIFYVQLFTTRKKEALRQFSAHAQRPSLFTALLALFTARNKEALRQFSAHAQRPSLFTALLALFTARKNEALQQFSAHAQRPSLFTALLALFTVRKKEALMQFSAHAQRPSNREYGCNTVVTYTLKTKADTFLASGFLSMYCWNCKKT